ncbi:MAG: LacI family transcriptional regulator [Propionibacteriaceae bacterium]|jgi:LacI family transcriptional regulator|nr:LacI family transcriptional regulator [Propionibacteriaceae bacterium]
MATNPSVVTLKDVASVAGVSVATASKALNGRQDVAEATRSRVAEVAGRLGFTRNELARSLLSQRSGTIGLLTGDLDGRFVLPILRGAEDAFGAGAIDAFLCDARGDVIREQHHLNALLTRRVDGIIVVGRSTDSRASLGQNLPIPVVYAYAPSDDPRDLSLTPDNVSGGELAVHHLLDCGRTRIGHITGDPTRAAAQDRTTGFLRAMEESGSTPCGEVMASAWSEQWGRDATAVLLEQHRDLDAIVAGSDLIARGVLDAVRDSGRTVPDDVAVIGYDNWSVLVTGARPGLTSIDSNLERLGHEAARHLFRAMSDDDESAHGVHHLPVRLVIRGSTIAHR